MQLKEKKKKKRERKRITRLAQVCFSSDGELIECYATQHETFYSMNDTKLVIRMKIS